MLPGCDSLPAYSVPIHCTTLSGVIKHIDGVLTIIS